MSCQVVSGGDYSQPSDVYSLVMVLWEIVAPLAFQDRSSNRSQSHSSHGHSFSPNSRPSAAALMAALNASSYPESDIIWSQLPFGDCKSQKEVRDMVQSLYFALNLMRPLMYVQFRM